MQSLPGAIGLNDGQLAKGGDNGAFCTPAYFNNRVYYLGTNDVLKAFEVRDGKLSATPVSQSQANQIFPGPGKPGPGPGATPSVSANGSSNGIVVPGALADVQARVPAHKTCRPARL